jgi:hypothetical protein
MQSSQDSRHTNGASAPCGSPASRFAPRGNKGPGLFPSRKHTRSCRCALARRICGCASALARTKGPVRRTRLKVADTSCARLVSGPPRRLYDGEIGLASASSDSLCGIRQAREPWHFGALGLHVGLGGSAEFRPLVTDVMTFDSCPCSSPRAGLSTYLPTLESNAPPLFA